jgi:hypothetical protein
MGRLIPAGTGLGAYKRLSVHVDEPVGEELPPAPMTPPASSGAAAVALNPDE